MTFCSIVGHASFQTAETMGPSISERSYRERSAVDAVAMRYVARVYYIGFRAMGNRDAARRERDRARIVSPLRT
jgi:hypothetical protein